MTESDGQARHCLLAIDDIATTNGEKRPAIALLYHLGPTANMVRLLEAARAVIHPSPEPGMTGVGIVVAAFHFPFCSPCDPGGAHAPPGPNNSLSADSKTPRPIAKSRTVNRRRM
jgi:hypothetical protein